MFNILSSKKSPNTSNIKFNNDQQKFEVIINTIDDGVVLVDDKEIVQLFNPAAEKITGWKKSDAVGMDVNNILKLVNDKNEPYPDDLNPIKKVFLVPKPLRDNNANLLTVSNIAIPISLTISPVIEGNDKVSAAVISFRNISVERAEEQKRAEFISTASHEMRTPVAAIEGYLSLALNSKVATIDERASSYLQKAYTSTQRLGKLFQDLLTSAKAEDGRLSSHPVIVELGGFLEQLEGDLKFSAEKKNLFSEFVIGSSKNIDASTNNLTEDHQVKPLYYVLIDPDRMREVLINLFDNAVKYTEEGKISIGITGDSDIVQCYVRDTGVGIPTEDIPHLFQKFYRVDSSATRTIGGTGLGLFISKKIVELYQGRIWVESQLGKGTTFFINLPRISNDKAIEMQGRLINPS